jgi:methyltransferase
MVMIHVGLLVGSVVEVVVLQRAFFPWLGWPALVGVILAQGLRWWCIATLGPQWNTRIVVVPGAGRVTSGPYKWLRHPNYVAVVVEGVCLPLVHTAWITATTFSVANAWVLRQRVPAENRALELLDLDETAHDR